MAAFFSEELLLSEDFVSVDVLLVSEEDDELSDEPEPLELSDFSDVLEVLVDEDLPLLDRLSFL